MMNLIGQHSMKSGGDSLAAYADHEILTAERMKWWGVFLIREKRRLQGIANAIHGNAKTDSWDDASPEHDEIEQF